MPLSHEKPHAKQIKSHQNSTINQIKYPHFTVNLPQNFTYLGRKNNAILYKFLYKNTSIKLYKYTILLHKIAHILTYKYT